MAMTSVSFLEIGITSFSFPGCQQVEGLGSENSPRSNFKSFLERKVTCSRVRRSVDASKIQQVGPKTSSKAL